MLKELLCLCLCVAVALAQDQEPPNDSEPQLHGRFRRAADGTDPISSGMNAMGQIPKTFMDMGKQAGDAFGQAAQTAMEAGQRAMGSMGSMGMGGFVPSRSGRNRRQMQPDHRPPMPPKSMEGQMPNGQQQLS